MKSTLLTLTLLVGSLAYATAQEPEPAPEPESRPEAPQEIEAAEESELAEDVEEVQQVVEVRIVEEDDDDDDDRRRKKQRIRTCSDWDVELGFTNWFRGAFDIVGQNNEPYALNNLQSLHFALSRNFTTYFPGPFAAEYGMSISAQGFAFNDPSTTIDESGTELEFIGNNPVDGRPFHSQLGVSHLNLYVVPMIDLGVQFGIGGYVGYRLTAANTRLWINDSDDLDFDRQTENYNTLPYRYGLRAQLGIRQAQLFMNYDMTEIFYRDRGPRLRTFSLGVIL
ncbi:MAG TPA: hypothetical protein DCP28_25380 [Cytophagales bacterium]|nr:hypothetical protein [Cytophagales bacterium]